MKKNLFLLGTFMSGSLVAANTLTLIACQKKISDNKGDKTENEKDTGQVEIEKSVELKAKITSIIDDVIANPDVDSEDEWIIKIKEEWSTNFAKIIKSLDDAVASIGNKDGEIVLDQVPSIDSNLINKVKEKFASLSEIIKRRINKLEDELGISNFDFDLASIKPMLTALTGDQVVAAVAKLQKPIGYNVTNSDSKTEDKIDLFKVKTNLYYDFKFGSTSFNDNYKDAELLLVGDIANYREINRFTQKTISDLFTK